MRRTEVADAQAVPILPYLLRTFFMRRYVGCSLPRCLEEGPSAEKRNFNLASTLK